MSLLRVRKRQIVVGVVLLAALAAIVSGIVHFSDSLANKSVPEHPLAWAEVASRFQGRRIGVMCSSADAVDSVDRARLIAISWACSPHPPLAIDFSDVACWPQVIISSAFLSASNRRCILGLGYCEVGSNEFAIAWTSAGVAPADPPEKVSPPRESVGVVVVLSVMLALWVWWRRSNGAFPSKWAFCCAAIVFAMLAALTLTHTLTSPNGLGVYAGKAKLFFVSGGIPSGFFTSPEYTIYQPSYPPGLTLAALCAYVGSWACGDWLVQLIVPFALSLLFLELADRTSRLVALAVALAMVSVPVAMKMAGGFYAEPLAALVLVMGLHRIWRRGDCAGWLMAGASGLFRHECIVLVIALWAAERLSGAGAKWRHLAVAAAFSFVWETFACLAGARVYDFDFSSWPAVRRVLLALAAAFSWKVVAAVVVLCAAGGRRCGHVAAASLLFLLASALLASFNVTPHFEWFLANTMPRVVWLAVIPLAACAILEKHANNNKRKETKLRVDRLVCALAGATLLIGGSYADTANNSFASVSGNGVVADGESGFCITNVEGPVEVMVTERPGWKCEKDTPFCYEHKEGDVDYFTFFGRDDEESATIAISNVWECVHDTTNSNEHVSAPGAEIMEKEHVLMIYSWPEEKGCELHMVTNICLPGLIGHHTNKVFAVPCPNPKCDYGKGKNPIGGSDVEIDPSPVIAELIPLAGGIAQDDGRILYPFGEYLVGYAAHYTNTCKDCEFTIGVDRFIIDICRATSMAEEYIGLDRSDAGHEKDHTMSGGVTLDFPVGKASCEWTVKPHCKVDGADNGSGVLVKVKRIAGELPGEWDSEYSSSYRQECLMCNVKLKDDCSPVHEASTKTTNEFTIVKVDVRIDDVAESLEEKDGAYTYYVPDGDAPIWAEEWTNSLKDVSITCEPHDGEMAKQVVKLTFDDGFLWVEKDNGTVERAKHSYTVEELNKTKFKLHGHKKSEKYKDKEIVAEHVVSHAIDKAKFTVFGRPWLIPDYDRKNGIEDGEDGVDAVKARGGIIPFRFWINDDDDTIWEGWKIFWIFTYWFEKGNICEENTDIPGAGNNFGDDKVNGRADLVDFAPVLIDISDVFPDNIPDNIRNTFTWKLDSDCLNIVWTDLVAANAAAFHTQEVPNCGTGLKKQSYEADSIEIGYGREFDKAFDKKIREVGKLVVLVEGRSAGRLFRISGHAPGTKAWTWGAVNISISKVEDMYRWMDLRYVCKDEAQGDNSERDKAADFEGREDVNGPVNNPDSDCNGDPRDGRHIVFVHGFNVNRDQARGWGAEFFKRLWQTGCTSKYTAADWAGDVGQITIPFDGKDSLNYYANVYNAFKTSEELAANCSKIAASDRLVLAAHSLGNMLASSTISDRCVVPSRYYMLNAAVAMEAYDGSSYNELMKDEAWKGLDRHPSQSPYWHTLSIFRPGDFRRTLTWNKRFSGLDNAVNCHSESDEILRDIEKGAWWGEDMGSVWTIQEKYKGSVVLPIANVLPRTSITREGGWGFNPTHIGVDVGRVVDTEKIKKLTDVQLLTDPVFTPFVTQEARLYSSEAFAVNDSKEQYLLRAKLLADAIPALSYSAGANETGGMIKDNVDYMKKCEAAGWPRKNKAWHHSDLKNVAYYFTYKLYEKISNDE